MKKKFFANNHKVGINIVLYSLPKAITLGVLVFLKY